MRSTNPILKEDVFKPYGETLEGPMTISGTINKLLIMAIVLLIGAVAVLYQYSLKHFDYVSMLMWAGLMVGIILSLVISFVKTTAPVLAPIYAFAEGACLAGISCRFESLYPGIVIQAISITMITALVMAVLYKLRLIQATRQFVAVILTATFAIGVFYIIALIMLFMGMDVAYFSINSPLSIGINTVIALIASFNLIIDFALIEHAERFQAPKFMEWYCAFGLTVTIVWMYIEILRLLSRLRSR